MKVPSVAALSTKPAPKRNRLRKGMMGLTLHPAALAIVDSLVGTFIGNTRSEVVRYIVVSWITDHQALIKNVEMQL